MAHVLVIDDDPGSARNIATIVSDLGHRATVANDWAEAIRVFGGKDVDLVLMDAVMPGVDGFKLTRILRSRATSYVPILFLTGLADANAREQGIACGADDFLTKPVDRLELKVRLTAMLRIRELTRQLEEKSRVLAELAEQDALTGLSNRRTLDARLAAELDRGHRYQRPVSLLMLDIDHFKRINDTFGHAVGDAVLDFTGRLLNQLVRTSDLVFRFGGEEFLIIAPETDAAQAESLAERVRRTFEQKSADATAAGRQTISVGVSGNYLMSDAIDAAALVESADQALYRAKNSGRNRVCIYAQQTNNAAA